MNYPTQDEALKEQYEDQQAQEWDMARSQIQQIIDEFGLSAVQWFVNSLKPKNDAFAFGYDDNAHLIRHRDDEF